MSNAVVDEDDSVDRIRVGRLSIRERTFSPDAESNKIRGRKL